MTTDNTVWTNHDTGPASDAFIGIGEDHSLFSTADGAGNAGVHARRVFTMTA